MEAGGAEALAKAMVNRLATITVATKEEDIKEEDIKEDTKAKSTKNTKAEDTKDTKVDQATSLALKISGLYYR